MKKKSVNMNLRNQKNYLAFIIGSTAQPGTPAGGQLSNGELICLHFLATAVSSLFLYHYIIHPVLQLFFLLICLQRCISSSLTTSEQLSNF